MALTSMDKIKPIVDAVKQHSKQYDSGDTDYSVTTLQDPARIVQLEKRHGHKVPFEVQKNLASFMGTAIHHYVEVMLLKANPDLYRLEECLEKIILNRKVSGAFDILMDDTQMFDIKTTKPHNYYYNDRKHWTAQQNQYRLLVYEKYGIKVKKLTIIFWAWIWEKFKMMQNKRYPRQQVVEISLPVWSFDRTREYMEKRVQYMIDNEDVSDVGLPSCEREDYWGDEDIYAVHRKDRKKAMRLLNSMPEAQAWMMNYRDEAEIPLNKLTIETRPGLRRRCEDWCGIRDWCNQWTEHCSMKKGK